jgi:putative DNA primase/helicase
MKDSAITKTVGNLVAKHIANHKDQADGSEDSDLDLEVRSFGSIEAKPVAWLWPGRLALGKITLLTGDAGTGKSMLTVDVASRISRGEAFPDGPIAPLGDTFFIGAEDGAEDTIRPRLDAAGANVDRVYLIQGPKQKGEEIASPIDLSLHIAKLDRLLSNHPEAKLLVIDPIMDYLGPATNSDRATDVRRVLSPLRSLAEKHQVAVIAMNHLNKAGRSSKSRSLGSGAFVQVARIELRVVEDPEDQERRLLLPVKNNLAAAPGLAYRIESSDNGAGFAVWEEGTVDLTIAEVESEGGAEDRSALDEAQAWLLSFLSEGAVKASEAKRKANQDGISERTLKRAKKTMEIVTEQRDRCWWWRLSDKWQGLGSTEEEGDNNPQEDSEQAESSFVF